MMNIVTLNCWAGREFYPLMRFVRTYQSLIDVWCLQEMPLGTEAKEEGGVRHNLLNEFLKVLTGVSVFTYPSPIDGFRGVQLNYGTNVGLATLVRKKLRAKLVARTALYDARSEHAMAYPQRTCTGHLLAIEVHDDGNNLLIGNVHGLWTPDGKHDVPDRLEQSRRLASFLREQGLPIILTGDFNMGPDTRSAAILEEALPHNLVREYAIATTRTSHYPGTHPHADNAFVTDEVRVNTFHILPDIVSDHAPLFLSAELQT